MRKIISIALILVSLTVLINCSPKTAKTTAASSTSGDNKAKQESTSKAVLESNNVVRDDETESVATNKAGAETKSIDFGSMGLDQQMTLYSDMAPLRLETGRKIYTVRCAKCHEAFDPSTRNAQSWVKMLNVMAPKAKLNTDEHLMVGGYLVNNARK
jgi:hypothetical protein